MRKSFEYTGNINPPKLLEELIAAAILDPDVWDRDGTIVVAVDEAETQAKVDAVVSAHDWTKKSQVELDSTVTETARADLVALDKGTLDPVIADILTVLGI